ncbi:MAG: DUF2889 domain-containing protein [Clostridia bacterium]|nr:MAG: DUF2889 domain-containing protein [Clostridia bacterium]
MLVFNRNRSITCEKEGNWGLIIRASSVDTFHEMFLIMTIDMEIREIVEATGELIRGPYTFCRETMALLAVLKKMKVDRGISKEVVTKIGGPGGCTQFVDLVLEALRAVGQCEESFVTGAEGFDSLGYWHGKLAGKCYAHSHSLEDKRLHKSVSAVLTGN